MARKSRYQGAAMGPALRAGAAAGLYLRLSVEDGDDLENNSIGNQRKICLAFLEGRPELTLGGVYVDNGCTGMHYKRPGFQAMLADLDSGKLGCVVVKDISRLGRHYILTSEYVEKIFPEMGVRLICINDGFDSDSPDADRERLLMPFRLIMNDAYAKDTARKIRSSIHAKMRAGTFLPAAGSVPYGYLRDPAAATYAVDPESAPVVQRIFAMRAEGAAFNAIAKALNREQIPSPGRLRFERGFTQAEKYRQALWLRGTVRKITEDRAYLGCRIHGKMGRENLNSGKKSRPREAWQVLPDAHAAIVSQSLFDHVQAVNQAEREKRDARPPCGAPEQDCRALFQDKVFCGDCGARMTAGKYVGRRESGNSVYFNCNQYRDSGRQRCGNHYIRQETLLRALTHCLEKQVASAADVERLFAKTHRSAGVPTELAALQCRRKSVEAQSQRLLEDWAAGLADRETYLRLKQRYTEACAQLTARETALRAEFEAAQQTRKRAEQWLSAVRSYRENAVVDRGIVDALVDRILVYGDRSIRICLTYGDPMAMPEAEARHAG